ncbi:hypothetical protein ACWJIA_03790 [Lactobacillus crispatus]|nr:hypothetical protein [Lactobacillus crispatus]MDK6665569.1 hypothetical protein [Lactobacillus crispatus]
MQSRSISNQPTADQLVDYYNNLETVTNILDLSASSYGEVWLESAISKRTSNLSNEVVNRTITYVSQRIVTDTQAKIDKQIEKLEQLAKDHPNNQEIQNAINNLRDAKNSVTVDNITNAKAMENAIGTLDNYGSQSAYNKLKQDAENPPAEVNKDGLRSDVAEADKVKGDYNYYNATNKDAYDKALEAAQKVIDNPAATQQEVNDAKTALAAAKTALNGSATDKATLQKDVEDSSITKADSKYYNAS